MSSQASLRRAQSRALDARDAVREFHAGVVQPDMALVVFFCSGDFDLDVLAAEMHRLFSGVQVLGCTSAGEIGPQGYLEHSLSGASFSGRTFAVASACLEDLQHFTLTAGQGFAKDVLYALENKAPPMNAEQSFALLLSDGLSVREEQVTRALQSALGKIPLVGGSAGDGLDFGCTQVYFEGKFRRDAAVLIVANTPLPFRVFATHHFVATDERLVVTDADPVRRIVKEINGLPAAEEYARILGVAVPHLAPGLFAARPVVVVIDGASYVRSIQKANPDGSLTFYCAIENGLILRVATGLDLLGNLEQAFARIHQAIGSPQLLIGCDCLLRKLEIFQSPDKERIVALLLHNKTTGFGTYGEQFRGVHVNQTFTGIAFGAPPTEAHDA